MQGRRMFFVLSIMALAACAYAAPAQEKSPWDGVWTGTLGGSSKIAMTIAGNQVTAYLYRGAQIPVSYNKVAGDSVSFGDRDNYSVSIKRIGEGHAKATYHGRHGDIAASLTRQ